MVLPTTNDNKIVTKVIIYNTIISNIFYLEFYIFKIYIFRRLVTRASSNDPMAAHNGRTFSAPAGRFMYTECANIFNSGKI